jgi:Na+-driven multidrug efflux pump
VDTAFVGRLGLLPLAALGPNAALFNVIFFLCFTPLAVICTQNMAAANSKGDLEGVGRGFLQALAAMAGVSSILVLLLVLAPESVLGVFQTNADIMPFARTYCVIRWVGTLVMSSRDN